MIKNIRKASLPVAALLLICVLSFSASARSVKPKPIYQGIFAGKAFKTEIDSKLMGRKMPFNLILPQGYNENSRKKDRYPVIYLLHGLTGHYDDWANKTKLGKYAADYDYIIVMPEGDNGWYSDSSTVLKDKYESYIVKELIPKIDSEYRTKASRESRAVAGLSMGGYGAIKFGLKYPEIFSLSGSFSGALGAATWTEETLGSKGAAAESILSTYGKAESETRRQNDIFRMVRDSNSKNIPSLPFIYLDCGTEDFLFRNNRDFVALLIEKKIPHEFRQLPGGHNWKFWDSQIQEFLQLSEEFFEPKSKAAAN